MAAQTKSLIASERDEAARAAWRETAADLDAATLVFVDETRTHTALTPTRARAPRGERAIGAAPRTHGSKVTLLAALTPAGREAAMTLEGATDRVAFEAYVEQVLVPRLRSGQVVVLDNLSVHKGERTKALIEGAGCRLLFLPADSPDCNPIDEAFAKLKQALRRAGVRTGDALPDAIRDALNAITAADACGFFTHCGYPLPAQLL